MLPLVVSVGTTCGQHGFDVSLHIEATQRLSREGSWVFYVHVEEYKNGIQSFTCAQPQTLAVASKGIQHSKEKNKLHC